MRFWFFAALILTLCQSAFAEEVEEESVVWQESAPQLPSLPAERNFVSFYVSAASENQFFIDRSSLQLTPEGVVRYVVIVRAPSGVENISYEGIRCDTKEFRFYASLRADKSWGWSRQADWKKILGYGANRYRAVFVTDHFCRDGVLAASLDEIKRTFGL